MIILNNFEIIFSSNSMFVSVLCTDLSCKGEWHALLDVLLRERIHLVRGSSLTITGWLRSELGCESQCWVRFNSWFIKVHKLYRCQQMRVQRKGAKGNVLNMLSSWTKHNFAIRLKNEKSWSQTTKPWIIWEVHIKISLTHPKVEVSPRLQDESECQISPICGLPCACNVGV